MTEVIWKKTGISEILIRCLIFSGCFGATALLIDQYAIQQESMIRSTQTSNYQLETNSNMLKNYVGHLAESEQLFMNFNQSIITRLGIMLYEEMNFLNTQEFTENCEEPFCITFVDSKEIAITDILIFIEKLKETTFDNVVSLRIFMDDLEVLDILLDDLIKALTFSEDRFVSSGAAAQIPEISQNLGLLLDDFLSHSYALRQAIEQKSDSMHEKTITERAFISQLMSKKQILLLIGVFFQVLSLICLLIFFRHFLPLIATYTDK